jgi:transcriptional regulator with XRE-family HTH domain
MVDLGMSQKALAIAAGLNDTYARDLFTGRSQKPQAEHLQKIAAVLGCDLDDLMSSAPVSEKQVDNVVDFSGILPLHPSEFPLIRMWRILNKSERDTILAWIADLASRNIARRVRSPTN